MAVQGSAFLAGAVHPNGLVDHPGLGARERQDGEPVRSLSEKSSTAMTRRTGRRRRVVMRHKNQLTLPREVTDALHIREGDEVEFDIGEDGQVTLHGMTVVPADQAWFW